MPEMPGQRLELSVVAAGTDVSRRAERPAGHARVAGAGARHRAKLVALRSGCQASVLAVLAKQGLNIPVSDLFGVHGRAQLAIVAMDAAYRARVGSLRSEIEGPRCREQHFYRSAGR
ncbi:hypothetical protein ACWDKQ_24310 [Saccharopolyspora sp. NPDC000995]